MKKNIVIVGLCLAALFLLSRSCGLSSAYKDMRNEYNELKNITAADKKMSDARISELTNAIGQADEVIGQKERVIAEKSVLISRLSNQLDELIANEPVQPELENEPLVINLRGQINKLSNMYGLSQQVIALQSEEIDVLKGKCIALGAIGNEWKGQYEREHQLRLASEGLVTSLEKRVKSQGLMGKVKTVALGVTAGYLAYTLTKKK